MVYILSLLNFNEKYNKSLQTRLTAWNIVDGDTSYTLSSYIFMEATESGSTTTYNKANEAFCPNGICDRTYISLKIDQIRAIK